MFCPDIRLKKHKMGLRLYYRGVSIHRGRQGTGPVPADDIYMMMARRAGIKDQRSFNGAAVQDSRCAPGQVQINRSPFNLFIIIPHPKNDGHVGLRRQSIPTTLDYIPIATRDAEWVRFECQDEVLSSKRRFFIGGWGGKGPVINYSEGEATKREGGGSPSFTPTK